MPVLLPEDQWVHVASFLGVSDILLVSGTCWQLHQWCRLCKVIDSGSVPVDDAKLHKLLRRFPAMTELLLNNTEALSAQGYAALPAVLPQLTKMCLQKARLQRDAVLVRLFAVPAPLQSLRTLVLRGSLFVRSPAVTALLQAVPNLTSLELNGFRQLQDSDVSTAIAALPRLQLLNLSDCTTLCAPQLHSSTLTSLSLARCIMADSIQLNLPQLTVLDMSSCTKLTDSVAEAVVQCCSSLKHLNLHGCSGLVSPRIASQTLLTLDMCSCAKLDSSTLVCASLTTLAVAMNMALSSLSLQLPSIQ
eukprot:8347-Heterococcus_DN1.PRE.2